MTRKRREACFRYATSEPDGHVEAERLQERDGSVIPVGMAHRYVATERLRPALAPSVEPNSPGQTEGSSRRCRSSPLHGWPGREPLA